MTRIVTDHEMDRRKAMAKAQESLTNAMTEHGLTALEWVNVLNETTRRMVAHGLTEEWKDGVEECHTTNT